MNIKIEPYAQDRANEIADLYHASVHAIDEDTYTKAEQEAWAPTPPNYEAWVNRLDIKKPFLAVADEKVLGFIELEDDGHIDCAYTPIHNIKKLELWAPCTHTSSISLNKNHSKDYGWKPLRLQDRFLKPRGL